MKSKTVKSTRGSHGHPSLGNFKKKEAKSKIKKYSLGTVDMVQKLRMLVTLAEDMGLVSSIHMMAHNHLLVQSKVSKFLHAILTVTRARHTSGINI